MKITRQTKTRLLVTFSDGSTISKEKTIKELAKFYNIDLTLLNQLTYKSFKLTLQSKFSLYVNFELELL